MAAHKTVFQALASDFLMDAAFCAAHVSNQGALFQIGPYGGKITCVVFHRCAEENQVTFTQVLINSIQNHIHDSLFPGLLQTGAGAHIGHDTDIRPCFSDGTGNGAAYKPQSDECDGGIGHGLFFHIGISSCKCGDRMRRIKYYEKGCRKGRGRAPGICKSTP